MKTDHLALLRSGAPLSTRQQISLTLQLSWPAIMAQLATIIMQYIDAAMVGRLGASQSAAVGLVASTTWLFGGLSYAAAMGFNVLTAQRVGGGRLAEARNILKQALVLCLAFSVVMAALAAALSAPLPRLSGRAVEPGFLRHSARRRRQAERPCPHAGPSGADAGAGHRLRGRRQ